MPELLLCCALPCSHSLLFCALWCCLLLLQLFVLFNHLLSCAFSPFSTGFCHFRNFHTSLSPIFHTSLSPFFFINSSAFSWYLSFLLPDEACGRSVFNSTFLLFCIVREYFSSKMNAGTSSLLHTSVEPFSTFLRALVLPSTASILPSSQPPTFVRFLSFLYWVLSLS